jgi:DNA-binding transcriptional ArsR family regulator
MGRTKDTSFGEREKRLAVLARALGHPARIAILDFLARNQTCICGDIVGHLPLAQATVSQHLATLKEAGLIRGEIEGPRVCYCIDPEAWEEARQLFTLFLNDARKCC